MAKRIMVVDDSRVVRAEMEKMLEGSDMGSANSAAAVRKLLKNSRRPSRTLLRWTL